MAATPDRAGRSGLLLVGAGHAHLHVVEHAAELTRAGYQVTLLSPRTFHYSGVASATAVGALPPHHGLIDVSLLAARCGVAHHEGLLAGLDLDHRVAVAGDGTELAFDAVSINVGSVARPSGMTVEDGVLPVKPLSGLADLCGRLRDLAPDGGARVTVVGGGASGLELAGHLAVHHAVARVRVLEAGPRLGPDLPTGAARYVERLLAARGVDVRTGCAVSHLGAQTAQDADGAVWAHDLAVLATGLAAPPLVVELGLGDPDGIPVRATLQHRDHDHAYAVGDCAHFLPRPLPRVGVHGVRQGPVLRASLLARAAGDPLPAYQPPLRALSVLDLGAGVGVAVRGRWWWPGRAALLLKHRIDRRWLSRYQADH